MFCLILQWKDFNVDLGAFDAQMRADHPTYTGNQAHKHLELWFTEELHQDDQDLIKMAWDEIDENHAMTKSYRSAAQVKADVDAKRASGMAKLAALGLTADELKAILG
jgi:hypothetical protein